MPSKKSKPAQEEMHARAGGEFIAVLMSRDGLTKVVKLMGSTPPENMVLPMAPPFTAIDLRTHTYGEHRTYRITTERAEMFGMPTYRYLETI